ncbi:EthD family reductase [Nocardioides zeae]|uniref:EthD family reductase n=1 Tax=Nocardioides imazamoxiresistens TaxID=3231893 RepID=A0ABU3PSX1_9ACTN|nr:EthD family reductase [Nocardioides zeae]MDT9592288.1 EthD family reductase [Nocardioides zeae]
MFRALVVYAHPEDPEAFLRHYREVHAPLARAMPGLRSFTWGRCVDPAGGRPEAFVVATLEWPDRDTGLASLASPEGEQGTADLANFAGAGVSVHLVESEE